MLYLNIVTKNKIAGILDVNLTLTSVVFEFFYDVKKWKCSENLTLTSVVFEWYF